MTIRPTTRTRDVPARDDRPAIPGPRRHNGDVEEASARDQPIGRQISSVGANTPLVKLSIMLVTLISASSPKTRASVGLPAAISESKLRKNAIPPLLRSVWLATLNPALISVKKILTRTLVEPFLLVTSACVDSCVAADGSDSERQPPRESLVRSIGWVSTAMSG